MSKILIPKLEQAAEENMLIKKEDYEKVQKMVDEVYEDTKEYGRIQFVNKIVMLKQKIEQLESKLEQSIAVADTNSELADKYKKAIDKTIEYLEKHLTDNGRFLMLNEWQVPDLLRILKEVE